MAFTGFQPASEDWPMAPMKRCSGRGADTPVCSADTLSAPLCGTCFIQLVQASAVPPPGGYFSGFAPSGIETAKPRLNAWLNAYPTGAVTQIREIQFVALATFLAQCRPSMQLRRRQECRRCRHECPRHVPSNGSIGAIGQRREGGLKAGLLGFGSLWGSQSWQTRAEFLGLPVAIP